MPVIAHSGGDGPRVAGEAPRSPARVKLRSACSADIGAVTAIYAHYVLHGLASFEIDPPAEDEMARRHASVTTAGFPYLVAEADGLIAGYAYAAPYRTRAAYRYTVEDSVYIHHAYAGRGIGSALLPALIAACEAAGWRQMVAVIGDSANHASIRLHEKFGFARAGLLTAAGWKFERGVDSVLMQRALGAGDSVSPVNAPENQPRIHADRKKQG